MNELEVILIFVVIVSGCALIFLEKIPRIKQLTDENNLTNIIESRKYTFLSFLNFAIYFIAQSSHFPKLFHLIGIIFAVVTISIFSIEYSKKIERRGRILFNIICTSIALILQYRHYLRY